MILHILIAGEKRLSTPFYADLLDSTARALNEQLPMLRQQGRVAVYITDEAGIAHIIAPR